MFEKGDEVVCIKQLPRHDYTDLVDSSLAFWEGPVPMAGVVYIVRACGPIWELPGLDIYVWLEEFRSDLCFKAEYFRKVQKRSTEEPRRVSVDIPIKPFVDA